MAIFNKKSMKPVLPYKIYTQNQGKASTISYYLYAVRISYRKAANHISNKNIKQCVHPLFLL